MKPVSQTVHQVNMFQSSGDKDSPPRKIPKTSQRSPVHNKPAKQQKEKKNRRSGRKRETIEENEEATSVVPSFQKPKPNDDFQSNDAFNTDEVLEHPGSIIGIGRENTIKESWPPNDSSSGLNTQMIQPITVQARRITNETFSSPRENNELHRSSSNSNNARAFRIIPREKTTTKEDIRIAVENLGKKSSAPDEKQNEPGIRQTSNTESSASPTAFEVEEEYIPSPISKVSRLSSSSSNRTKQSSSTTYTTPDNKIGEVDMEPNTDEFIIHMPEHVFRRNKIVAPFGAENPIDLTTSSKESKENRTSGLVEEVDNSEILLIHRLDAFWQLLMRTKPPDFSRLLVRLIKQLVGSIQPVQQPLVPRIFDYRINPLFTKKIEKFHYEYLLDYNHSKSGYCSSLAMIGLESIWFAN